MYGFDNAFATEYEDFEAFEKFNKRGIESSGSKPSLKTKDYQIRTARRQKEKAKQAALEEIKTEE